MSCKLVPLRKIAYLLKMDRSNARKYVLKHGLQFSRIRTLKTRGQETLALSQVDTDYIVRVRGKEGFRIRNGKTSESKPREIPVEIDSGEKEIIIRLIMNPKP